MRWNIYAYVPQKCLHTTFISYGTPKTVVPGICVYTTFQKGGEVKRISCERVYVNRFYEMKHR